MRCALGVSDRTLSDSAAMASANMRWNACGRMSRSAQRARRGSMTYEATGSRPPRPAELDDHAQLWRNVRASIAADTSAIGVAAEASCAYGRAFPFHPFWAAFGSIAAVMALSVGFVALFVSHGGWPPVAARRTRRPRINPVRQPDLETDDRPQGLPRCRSAAMNRLTYTIDHSCPSDGNTAYACQADKNYVTSPRSGRRMTLAQLGRSSRRADLPANMGGCRCEVDANDCQHR